MTYLLDERSGLSGIHEPRISRPRRLLDPIRQFLTTGELLDHRARLPARAGANAFLRLHSCSGTYLIVAPEAGSPHLYSRRARCVAPSRLGQSTEADYRWPFKQTGGVEWRGPGNT